MLEKESIYCCQSGGPPVWLGRFLGVGSGEVRLGGGGFFSPLPIVFLDNPWHLGH